MLDARRAGSAAFPELNAARDRAARRATYTNVVMLMLVAAFAGFAFLLLSSILRLVAWVGSAVWDYLPRVLPSPDALAALADLLS